MTAMIEQGVQLDCALGCSKGRPWKDAQAQVDHTCVEGVEFVSESKPMLGSLYHALLIEFDEQRFVDLIRSTLVCISKCRAAHLARAEAVIEKPLLGLECDDEITQTRLPTQLGVDKARKLRPARE